MELSSKQAKDPNVDAMDEVNNSRPKTRERKSYLNRGGAALRKDSDHRQTVKDSLGALLKEDVTAEDAQVRTPKRMLRTRSKSHLDDPFIDAIFQGTKESAVSSVKSEKGVFTLGLDNLKKLGLTFPGTKKSKAPVDSPGSKLATRKQSKNSSKENSSGHVRAKSERGTTRSIDDLIGPPSPDYEVAIDGKPKEDPLSDGEGHKADSFYGLDYENLVEEGPSRSQKTKRRSSSRKSRKSRSRDRSKRSGSPRKGRKASVTEVDAASASAPRGTNLADRECVAKSSRRASTSNVGVEGMANPVLRKNKSSRRASMTNVGMDGYSSPPLRLKKTSRRASMTQSDHMSYSSRRASLTNSDNMSYSSRRASMTQSDNMSYCSRRGSMSSATRPASRRSSTSTADAADLKSPSVSGRRRRKNLQPESFSEMTSPSVSSKSRHQRSLSMEEDSTHFHVDTHSSRSHHSSVSLDSSEGWYELELDNCHETSRSTLDGSLRSRSTCSLQKSTESDKFPDLYLAQEVADNLVSLGQRLVMRGEKIKAQALTPQISGDTATMTPSSDSLAQDLSKANNSKSGGMPWHSNGCEEDEESLQSQGDDDLGEFKAVMDSNGVIIESCDHDNFAGHLGHMELGKTHEQSAHSRSDIDSASWMDDVSDIDSECEDKGANPVAPTTSRKKQTTKTNSPAEDQELYPPKEISTNSLASMGSLASGGKGLIVETPSQQYVLENVDCSKSSRFNTSGLQLDAFDSHGKGIVDESTEQKIAMQTVCSKGTDAVTLVVPKPKRRTGKKKVPPAA